MPVKDAIGAHRHAAAEAGNEQRDRSEIGDHDEHCIRPHQRDGEQAPR